MISAKRPGAWEDSGPPAANNSRRRTEPDPALVCFTDNADVAQLVEHNLAKVGVAGSNPVVRSRRPRDLRARDHQTATLALFRRPKSDGGRPVHWVIRACN